MANGKKAVRLVKRSLLGHKGNIMVFRINGGRALCGSLEIESAKNSVLPVMAAATLAGERVVIKKCPKIADVINMAEILARCGVYSEFSDNNLVIEPRRAGKCAAGNTDGFDVSFSEKVRTSVLMLGALSAKCGKAKIPYPGGCDLGARPVDIHISALKSLGAKVREEDGFIICDEPVKGGKAVLSFPSVGATENAIIAAATARGEAMIVNAAKEPEIVDLANFLNLLGAKVYGAGTSVVRVEGVKKLRGGEFTPSFDRIEAGTYLIAAAISGGEIELRGVKAENISALLSKLCDITCKFKIKDDIIYLYSGRNRKAFSLVTGPYPMFPTDLQAPMCSLAAVSDGVSRIKEEVFGKRFHHIGELAKMGAEVSLIGGVAKFRGVSRLHGAEVSAHDLRCGAALVLAGLNAEGTTVVRDIEHLERGYYQMDKKLRYLGADVTRG
ncbi:MAG: UDP-N-acetylglucosamine 1-carboxyvinyltransferase [Clostridia bacterium]|nr:UDP-N-acetylglucosamine 1-carboxyvinyltransferase [Clostridia bacterium]